MAMVDIEFAIRTAKHIQDAVADGATKQVQANIAKAIELTTKLKSITMSSAAHYEKLTALKTSIPENAVFNPVRSAIECEIEMAKSREWSVAKIYETATSSLVLAETKSDRETASQLLKSLEKSLHDYTSLAPVSLVMVAPVPANPWEHELIGSGKYSTLSSVHPHGIENFGSTIDIGLDNMADLMPALDLQIAPVPCTAIASEPEHVADLADFMPVLELQTAPALHTTDASEPEHTEEMQTATEQYGNKTQPAGQCPLLPQSQH